MTAGLMAVCLLLAPGYAAADPSATPPSPSTDAPAAGTSPSPPPSAASPSAASPTANPDATPADRPSPSPTSTTPGEPSGATSTGPRAGRAAPAAVDPSTVNVQKRNSLNGRPLQPGQDFTYNLVVQCSSLTTDCVNQTFTDVLPAGLDVTSLPGSTSARTVTYDAATRRLTVVFTAPIDPAGSVGLNAGDTVNFEIGMRLPTETPITTGTVITNTASTVADNAPEKTSTSPVTVSIPRVVRPAATKDWSDGTAVAGTDEPSTITLGIRNASSTSAEISALTVTDAQPATWENFDLTGATVAAFPAGADTAQLLICTRPASTCSDADYQPGPTTTGTTLAPPDGVALGSATGVRVRFTDAAGVPLPYDPTGGSVKLGLVLRDTERATGDPLRPAGKLTVNNCAVPSATDAVQGSVNGTSACKSYDILPDTLNLGATKSFFADSNGNFAADAGEYAVIGENSRVSGVVSIKNNSPFPVAEIVIREPGSGAGAAGNEFGKLDTDRLRIRYPSGATSAVLVVTYADGTTDTRSPANNASVSVGRAGTRVESIELTYRGVNGNGDATIAAGATAGLDLTGLLNDGVDESDLPGGSSPGVVNCAGFEGSAGRDDGTGTAAGNACATLDVRQRITTSSGTKTVGQTSVPLGQPIPFALRVANNGTLPLVDPVISDPAAGNDGRPDPTAPNPFDQLVITGATITKDANTPAVIIEVFDPAADAWAPFDADDTALLTRATGIRARMIGNLVPTRSFTLNLVTQRRPGTPDGVSILNCFSTGAGGAYTPGNPACAPRVQTGPVSQAGSLNKSISPSVLPREVPGVPEQYADVILTVRNNGNLSMKTLRATDDDVAFFDVIDFTAFKAVQFPRGANRIQIDALVDGAWVTGAPAAAAALPAGVDPSAVRGVRATFSSTNADNDGFVITPCAAGDRSCEGKVTFTISPRKTLRSSPASQVPTVLTNTTAGSFTTRLNPDPADPATIPPVSASLTLTQGTPKIDVDKTPNSTIGPGESAPFFLTVTNNGTANIPQLLVADALPAGMAFDESFAGDGGLPFKIVNAKVPAGTDPVPAPTFSTVADPANPARIGGLRFAFGDWIFRPGATFQIQLQVGLEPGVTVGQTLTNLMGATSQTPLPDLQCTAGDPVVTDGALGEGTFCTHTATVTVKAGAAFSARKWVAGRAELGWYNTRTQQRLAPGSRGCPSTTDAEGRLYTSYPCIALVDPGDRYEYLLRLVNAGTEPASEMRVIDKFPVAGDRGVILDQARLTQWHRRPTLASEPMINGPSGGARLALSYTDGAVCADDVSTDPTDPACAPGDWDDAFGPTNTGVQMRLSFPGRLAPGGSVTLAFSMDTPLTVDRVADPTIAWNSFAHAETTLRSGGTSNYLPPTEPIKVGVGLAYGTLGVTKAIGENPSNLPLDDVQFEFAYTCTNTPLGNPSQVVAQGRLNALPGQTATVAGIPSGAVCQVTETNAFGGVSSAPPGSPVSITIDPWLTGDPPEDQVAAVTVTNDFPDAVVVLRKVLTGPAAQFGRQVYPVDVSCTFNGTPVAGFDPKRVDVAPGTFSSAVAVPSGAVCRAVEADTGQATEVSYRPAATDGQPGSAPVQARSGVPTSIVITNELRAGGLVIDKELAGPGAPALSDGPFSFDVRCRFDGRTVYADSVTLRGDGSSTTIDSPAFPLGADGGFYLPVGAECTITETDDGGADATPAPVTVRIPDEIDGDPQVVRAGFTNAFSAGTVSVTKVVDGSAVPVDPELPLPAWIADATFTVDVTCQRRDADGELTTLLSRSVAIRAGETIDLVDANGDPVRLPLGTHCFGTETNDGGATAGSVDFDSFDNAAVVTTGDEVQPLRLVATNTFDVTGFAVTKRVTGPGATFATGRQFTVRPSCLLDQGGSEPTELLGLDVRLRDGETVAFVGLPVGARCSVTEPDDGGATSTTVESDGEAPVPVTPGDPLILLADPAGVTVTNRYEVASLTVGKMVVDGAAGPYGLAVDCTTDAGPVDLGSQGRFSLKDGQRRTLTVPLGAECTVTEPDAPAAATVGFTDSDGTNDGRVVMTGDASVTVTNTFAPAPPPGPTPPGPTPPGPTPPGPGTDDLADTGAPGGLLGILVGALALVAAGVALVALARRREGGR